METLTQDALKAILTYDPLTGWFFWNATYARGRRNPNGQAGTAMRHGYIRLRVLGTYYLAHRLAWFYQFGVWPKEWLDHIDHDPSNNAIANLRECSHPENMQNMAPKKPGSGKSLFRGIWKHANGKSWHAQITVNYKKIQLGHFPTEEEAGRAYLMAKRRYHPFFVA